MNTRKLKLSILIICFLIFLFQANFADAVRAPEIQYPEIPFSDIKTPNEFIRDINASITPAEDILELYIRYFYSLIVIIGALAVFASIVYGGFQYLLGIGKPGLLVAAKDRISSGLLGLIILFSAQFILTAINPQLSLFSFTAPEPERCDCARPRDQLSDYCKVYCQTTQPTEDGAPVYIEVPLGKMTEWVIKRSEEAEVVASTTNKIAQLLKTKTERLNYLTQRCNCTGAGTETQCTAGGCTGGVCIGEPCPDRAEIDSLISTTVVSSGSGDPPPEPPPGCFKLEVNADYIGGQVRPSVCLVGGNSDGDITLLQDGSLIAGPNGWNGGVSGWRFCYSSEWVPPIPLSAGQSATVTYTGVLYRKGGGDCSQGYDYSLPTTFTIDSEGNLSYNSNSGATVILGEIPKLIKELQFWRWKTFLAKSALQRAYINLKLTEDILRDSVSSPMSFGTYIGIEQRRTEKINQWANIDITYNPVTNLTTAEDPATFYITKKGNEELIRLVENVAAPITTPPPAPGTCSTGQTKPYSICDGTTCVTIDSCGENRCNNCGSPPDSCSAGETRPHSVCDDISCRSVDSCGKNTCTDSASCVAPPSNCPTGSGPCESNNLIDPFSGDYIRASAVCQGESGSNPNALANTCGNSSVTYQEYSVGLFQMNLAVGRCNGGVEYTNPECGRAGGFCSTCAILDWDKVRACESDYGRGTDIYRRNVGKAYDLYRYSGWCPWSVGVGCGFCR